GEAMDRMRRIAVGRFWTRGKEQLVLIRPYKGGLCLHQVYYSDEVRSMDDVERPGAVTFKPIEEELADKLISELSVPEFKPEQYHDEYKDRVEAAVEQKAAGQEITTLPEQPQAEIIDLFEALKRSLKEPGAIAANQPAAAEPAPVEEPMGIKKAPAKKA